MQGSAVSLAGHSRTPWTSGGSPGAEWAKEVKTNVIVMTTRSATVRFIAAPPDRARSRISIRRRSIARYSGAAALTGGPVSPLIASPIMVARARFDVTGRTCLVTGAGRGIGRATAEAFASAGARVTVADVDEASAKSVADGIAATGGQACAIGLDVGSAISVETGIAQAARFGGGRLDVLINNAGVNVVKATDAITLEEWGRSSSWPRRRPTASPATCSPWTVDGSRSDAVMTARYGTLFDLSERVAIVTGGGGALGGAIAQGLTEFGARVVLADLDAALAKTAASGITGATADVVDVTDPVSATALAERVQGAFGRIDILINAAGIFRVAPALELSMADWDAVLRVNLTGIFVMTRAVAPHMLARGRGNVVNITSVSSVVANPEYAAYAASKGGAMQLTRVLGVEWCRQGIAVNAIAPAFTETPLTRGYLARPGAPERVVGRIPMGRLAEPSDIVGAAVFLASDAASFMVGQTLFVDGGRTL